MNHSPVALLQELLKCGTDIPVWHYDMDGHLLDTNSEHLVLDKVLENLEKAGAGGSRPLKNGELGYVAGKTGDENAIRKAAAFLYKTAKNYSYNVVNINFSASNSNINKLVAADGTHKRGTFLHPFLGKRI